MVKNGFKWLLVTLLVLAAIPTAGSACTTFFLDYNGQQVFGKNYDWHLGFGLMIANQRGVAKKAMPGFRHDPVEYASWTSKYGSLTFNQYGREMPTGGMNEAGLVVHLMALYETKYPRPDSRQPIKDLQWIQYQLDNYSSVKEVIANDAKIRILYNEVPGLHFMVADKTGDCASIEWIRGKMVSHTGEKMPVRVLANNTYKDSMRYLERHKGHGGTLAIDHTSRSLDRFVRAAHMLESYSSKPEKPMVEYAFDILRDVAQGSTQWSIVYDLPKLKVYFKTYSDPGQNIRTIDLSGFDLSCNGPVKVMDLDTSFKGNITGKFSNYTREANARIINQAFNQTHFVSNMPQDLIDIRIAYPENTSCSP
ncbi:MAG: linear amide C-N hydrolase [Desulfobacteraceae bacterium]|nr:linear amide C-N hydrolase [Desulfobacteraceae bacterium]